MARFDLAGRWVLGAVQDDEEEAADIAIHAVGVGVVGDDGDRDKETAAAADESCRERAVADDVMLVAPGS